MPLSAQHIHTSIVFHLLNTILSLDKGRIEGLYQVERDGENEQLRKCKLDNHRLLFHGTNVANLISILSRGLLLAPVDCSLRTGARFGEVCKTLEQKHAAIIPLVPGKKFLLCG